MECCSICLTDMTLPGSGTQRLPCGHVFHETCIFQLRRFGITTDDAKCPNCRRTCEELLPVEALTDRAVHAFIQNDFDTCAQCSLEILIIAARHPQASALLADLHLTGRGVALNWEKSLEYANVAKKAGIRGADVILAQLYLQGVGRNVRDARQIIESLTRDGDSAGFAMMAAMYYGGDGVTEDYVRAFVLSEQAHAAGDPSGTVILVQICIDGNAPIEHTYDALQLAQGLHDGGDPRGTYLLAQIYLYGVGVNEDGRRGLQLAYEAKDAGVEEANIVIDAAIQAGLQPRAPEDDKAVLMHIINKERTAPEFVAVLETKRTPEDLRCALLEQGAFELESGAKVFVRDDQFDTVCHTVEALDLGKFHVIVSLEYENMIKTVIQNVGQGVGPRRNRTLLETSRTYSVNPDVPVQIKRTFIQLKVPSSLLGSSSSNGHAATY